MSKNKGVFTILKKKGENVIVYIENGETTYLDLYSFVRNEDAVEYLKNHKVEIDNYVTNLKTETQRKEAEKEAAEKRKAEEKLRKKKEKRKKKKLRKEKTKAFWSKGVVIATASSLITTTVLVGGHFIAVGVKGLIEKGKQPTSSQTGNLDPTQGSTTPTISTTPTENDELTDEKFEEVSARFSKVVTDAGLNLSTDDVVEFASIINIDKLCKDNAALAEKLFSVQTKEEYLNETFKVLGQITQYNSDLYFSSETKGTTQGFIRVSDVVVGEKEKATLKYYELLVDRMAIAANEKDREKVNLIAEEFLNSINDPTSEFSYVSDGIGMGLYESIIEMMNIVSRDVDGICYLSDINMKKLRILSSSEKYISNIFTKYDECVGTVSYTFSYDEASYENDATMYYGDISAFSYTRGRRL